MDGYGRMDGLMFSLMDGELDGWLKDKNGGLVGWMDG